MPNSRVKRDEYSDHKWAPGYTVNPLLYYTSYTILYYTGYTVLYYTGYTEKALTI